MITPETLRNQMAMAPLPDNLAELRLRLSLESHTGLPINNMRIKGGVWQAEIAGIWCEVRMILTERWKMLTGRR